MEMKIIERKKIMNGFGVFRKLREMGYKDEKIREFRFLKQEGYWYVVKHNYIEWADDIQVIEVHETIEIIKDDEIE